jgi:histidinol phosphatase-like PHP family hydrolase
MIDLHTHSLLSDGELLPEELVRRYEAQGYKALAITDHVGPSNLEQVIEALLKLCERIGSHTQMRVIPGVEITHCPPALIPHLIERSRSLGASLILVHGETIVEPVPAGTNLAAIEGKADILAHPGLISPEEVELAKKFGVFLEISGRRGHCLTNGHLVKLAKTSGAKLVFGSDAHAPQDIPSSEMIKKVALGAGLSEDEFKVLLENMETLVKRCRSF